jgi:hypothetical protein
MTTLASKLRQYTGTEQYHRLTLFGGFVCTDGVYAFAEEGGAYWVLDLIASYQPQLRNYEFQHWKIISHRGKFIALCTDGNGYTLVTQEGDFTDLEDGDYSFYLTNKVLMVESEY